jgi:hypothetical protein
MPEPRKKIIRQTRSVSPRSTTSIGLRPAKPSFGASSQSAIAGFLMTSANSRSSRSAALSDRRAGSPMAPPASQVANVRSDRLVNRASDLRDSPNSSRIVAADAPRAGRRRLPRCGRILAADAMQSPPIGFFLPQDTPSGRHGQFCLQICMLNEACRQVPWVHDCQRRTGEFVVGKIDESATFAAGCGRHEQPLQAAGISDSADRLGGCLFVQLLPTKPPCLGKHPRH